MHHTKALMILAGTAWADQAENQAPADLQLHRGVTVTSTAKQQCCFA